MKIFYIEHTPEGLVLTDFEDDILIKLTSVGSFHFPIEKGYKYDNYIKHLEGCDSFERLMDAAGDAGFRIIDDPKNRARARYHFGRKIMHLRKKKGIPQSELAEKAGIKVANLISIELGRYSASFDTIYNLAKALGEQIYIG